MEFEYPTLLRRYFSTIIDGLLVILIIILSSYLLDNGNDISTTIRVSLIIFMFFVYEPVFTSFFCTLRQKITGIRVRKSNHIEHINIFQAYVRILLKIILGIISFFTIPFSKNKRAIHDMAVRSLVIYHK